MAAVTAAAVGGAAALGGAAMSASATNKASKRAAAGAQFNPFNINIGDSGVDFGDNSATFREGGASFDARQSLEGAAVGGFAGINPEFLTSLGQAGEGFQQTGIGQMPGAFQGVDDSLTGGQALDASSLGKFTGITDQALQGLGTTAEQGQRAVAGAFGPGRVDAAANASIAGGFGLLGQNFDQVAADQLQNLRDSARPMEDRAVNSKFQNLFGTGRLGTTGGAQILGDLAQRQETADIDRQVASRGLATNLLDSNRQTGLGMIGQGFQGVLGGQNANTGMAGTVGGLGNQATGMISNIAGNQLNATQGFGDRTTNRAGQRLQNANEIFGFGAGLQDRGFNMGANALGLTQSISADARNTIALGGNIGNQQANAGANAGSFMMQGAGSGVGAGLSGLGQGLLTAGMNNINFNPTTPPPTTPPIASGFNPAPGFVTPNLDLSQGPLG